MAERKMHKIFMNFSVLIIGIDKEKNFNRINRSETAIVTCFHEMHYAHGNANFTAKFQIALKEANETGY